MKLYHCAGARSFRALWTLEELGLDYSLETMPFPPRFTVPGYLDINPLGTIPFFTDGPAAMTESAAICEYLVTKYGSTSLAVTPDEPNYGAYLNWLHHGEATLTFPQTLVLRYRVFEPAKGLQAAADDYAKWFAKRTVLAAAALETRDYLCAGRFTAADISVGYALLLAERLDLLAGLAPSLIAYWARLQARDGFTRAVAAERR
ncbi:glutathione S-transferase family protein [Glacieibacterium megasporae]|uniref:glutathione S-transferase family protein n=1 Tax=Glacieibacterium megasporae TaxID=2835787 RepID=UPI001C1DFCC7|nr:glutathione S-transferase [Polymorphobacter megasporae]UAJ09787.1 glutathione S-transferase [Polymorphobacter megasporae]